MIAGLGLLIAEIFVTSFGLLFVAGIVCFLVGGTIVFEQPEVSDLNVDFWSVLVPAVAGLGIFSGLVVFSIGRTMFTRQTAGVDEMIGLIGRAASALDPDGRLIGLVENIAGRAHVLVNFPPDRRQEMGTP